jgi:hypothetical protein
MYGSQGAQRIETRAELDAVRARDPDLLIQDYLPGAEYTIDCFTDRHGCLQFCSGRQRQRIRMGTSMHGFAAPSHQQGIFKDMAARILSVIPLRGAWFFQMKEDSAGSLVLLEVEARIAGTMALNRARGVNFPLLWLYDLAGYDIRIEPNADDMVIDRALVNRFSPLPAYSRVYVDLDDTLIVHGVVNTQLAMFLYQCVNKGIELVLISKSLAPDRNEFLKRHRLQSLFDEILWLDETQSKADFIRPEGAIFIDDSFSQRHEVADRHNIPTFDPSMVERLLDERA